MMPRKSRIATLHVVLSSKIPSAFYMTIFMKLMWGKNLSTRPQRNNDNINPFHY